MQNHILLFAVIDEANLDEYLQKEASEFSSLKTDKSSLLKDKKFLSLVYADVLAVADRYKLNSLEIPKHMMLIEKPFTVEDDLVTPTMKLKRNVARKVYANDIERMYKEGPQKYK